MDRFFLISILLLFAISQFAYGVSVGENGTKLRTGPGFNFPIDQELPRCQPLKILEKSGEWYKVTCDFQRGRSLSGWAHQDSISNKKTLIVSGCRIGNVNLRNGPGTHYQKVAELYQGYLLEVLTKKGNWYKVRIVDPPESKTGWINSAFVWPK